MFFSLEQRRRLSLARSRAPQRVRVKPRPLQVPEKREASDNERPF